MFDPVDPDDADARTGRGHVEDRGAQRLALVEDHGVGIVPLQRARSVRRNVEVPQE